jgi:hypothetical protein
MELPLPWERLIWKGRSRSFPPAEYALTDVRLVAIGRNTVDELTAYDIGEIRQTRTWLDRLLGTSSLTVATRDPRRSPLTVAHIRDGHELAALLELLTGDVATWSDVEAARHVARSTTRGGLRRRLMVGGVGLVLALAAVGAGVTRHPPSSIRANTSPEPAIGPARDRAAMIRFMEDTVMPWARVTLAPIVGGADRVTCETCHGPSGREQGWQMPAVAALPEEVFRERGWEHYSNGMDTQLRNAIYGYTAQSDKQGKATYMREFVMPGMARLLERPAYDFTRTYDFNRRRQAFGCYHCHRVR